MRATLLGALLALAACGQAAPPRADLREARPAAPAPWFICDGIDQPFVFIFADDPADARARLFQIDKTSGETVFDAEVGLGPQEGAAGSVYTQILHEGANAGAIRQINPGVLETPGSAYTTPIVSVSFGNVAAACRWLPRTRLLGVTERRSLVVHEDADGDLIYTSFDFADAANRAPIELSENGRSTAFSAEVRGGEESVSPDGAVFSFATAGDYAYRVTANGDGAGRVSVLRHGETILDEPFIAFQLGAAVE
jgi:hypothetical protein